MKSICIRGMIVCCVAILPVGVFANTGGQSAVDMITQMQNILEEYKTRIQRLEAENTMLRELMSRHEIQIPLDDYTKLMGQSSSMQSGGSVSTGTSTVSTGGAKSPAMEALTPFQRGFITQIHADWEGIKGAYQFPADSILAGYEFVKDDAGNHVFASVLSGTGTQMGAYNYKLLYEVDTQTYARKLLGLFVFSDEAKAYITRIGKNPFPKHERHFVIDPYRAGRPITPPTTPTVPATQNPTVSKTDDALLKELSSAYHAKDYTRTLKITDDYLKNNAPTYDILRYRYRVFFIMKDYSKSISEIEKMESLGMVDRITACDAYVIATWAGKKALADGYKSRAGTCRTN